jgi:small subunit ribosomal protein S8
MTMTDPIADMLTRIRNGNRAYHDTVTMPSSTIKVHIAEILKQEGYIAGFSVSDTAPKPAKGGRPERPKPGKQLQVELKYGPNRERSLAGIRRISKPGLRVYAKAGAMPRVLGGLGIAIVSTSNGLMTERQAAKAGVGGEVLAFIY